MKELGNASIIIKSKIYIFFLCFITSVLSKRIEIEIDNGRGLGFYYDKKPFTGSYCRETYSSYLITQSSRYPQTFDYINCQSNNYCSLKIIGGDYNGQCLGGSSNIYSQACSEYSSRFKILDDGRIITLAGNYLGIGNSYSSDCDNFNYIEVSETGYKFNIKDIKPEENKLIIQN